MIVSRAGQIVWSCACEKCGAFIDLVERVRADDSRIRDRIDGGLNQREDGFARAINGNDMARSGQRSGL